MGRELLQGVGVGSSPCRESQDLSKVSSQGIEVVSSNPTLLSHLHEIQRRHGYLPRSSLAELAEKLGRTLAEIEGVASFYHFFHLEPRGEYRLYFSDCIIDRFHGAPRLLQRLCRKLGVEIGRVREDGRVSVAWTSCTGLCDQGPALLVEGRQIGRLNEEKIDRIAELIERRVPASAWPADWFEIEDRIQRKDLLLQSAFKPGEPLEKADQKGPEWVLEALQQSGLLGRGGAGFPTWLKWKFCREAEGERYIVCNADEGEPGTFKDRFLLSHHADEVIEGMTLAALVTEAKRGLIYLRGEYEWLLDHLQAVLERRRRAGLLGSDFDLDIVLGAGAYICGEESALLNSIEGKRPAPRLRPPYPVTKGLFGQPTVVNNVETFFAAAHIVQNGGDWFAAVGTEQSKGTRLLSISGDCPRPGIYEIPFGVTVGEVLELCGASETLGVQVGGPSGSFLGPGDFHRKIAYEDVGTAGAFMVFAKDRDLFEIVENFIQFFQHESCGFCTPCRVGTSLLAHFFEKIKKGRGTVGDLRELEEIGEILAASHCGLGHTAFNPIRTTLAALRERYHEKIRTTAPAGAGDSENDFSPGFDLDAELEQARRLTGRLGDHIRWDG